MIVPMKKVTLLCLAAEQERTLQAVRRFGRLHVTPLQPPEGRDLEAMQLRRKRLRHALERLDRLKIEEAAEPTLSVDDLLRCLEKSDDQIDQAEEALAQLAAEQAAVEPFGVFDPLLVRELENREVYARLYKTRLGQTVPHVPDAVVQVFRTAKKSSWFAVISREPTEVDAEPVLLPDMNPEEAARWRASLEAERDRAEARIGECATARGVLRKVLTELEREIEYVEVRKGMAAHEPVSVLTGFCPAENEAPLREAAARHGWGLLIEKPGADDPVPTLLRNPKWVAPIKAAFDVIDVVPGYRELDVSALFLIFLSVFFAFIIGDAGYGLLFVALTLLGKYRFRDKPAARPGLNLLMIMSAATVLFGMLTGNYFGIPIERLPAPLKMLTNAYMTGWTGSGWDSDLAASHIMFICFTIAVVHLSIAHLWNLVRKINSPDAVINLGWFFCTCSLYAIVLELVLDVVLFAPVQAVKVPLLATGALLVMTGLLIKKSYIGIITLFLDVISNFVDIISYIRLYAVGAASLSVAQAFNEMAAGVGFEGFSALGAALILFAGHALNIILGAMGVMVHGIRLNTLEFSGHAGVEWAGIPFRPFKQEPELE